MFSLARKYFDEGVVGVLAMLVVFFSVQIIVYFRKTTYLVYEICKGHTLHWHSCLILIVILILEFVGRIVSSLTSDDDNEPHGILRLTSCVLSIVAVLLSLVSYHVSERRSKRMNILGLLLLWIFLGGVYLIKVYEKTSSPTWQSCPLQIMAVFEMFISAISFLLLVIDLTYYNATRVRRRGNVGLELVHEYCCFLSKVSYHWVNKILLKGFKKPLEQEDLGLTASSEDVQSCYRLMEAEIEIEKVMTNIQIRAFSIWRCLLNFLKPIKIFPRLLHGISELLMFDALICLVFIADSLGQTSSNVMISNVKTFNDSYWMTAEGGIDKCPASFESFFFSPFFLMMMMLSTYLIRAPMKKDHDSMAYREGIRLNSALQWCITDWDRKFKIDYYEGDSAGVEAIYLVEFSITAHYAWSLPIQVICCLLLLYKQLGQAGAFGCMLVFILVPIQYCLNRCPVISKRNERYQLMDMTEKIDEMMEHIELLNMWGREDLFWEGVLNKLRPKPAVTMWRASIDRVIAATISDGIPSASTVFTFILYYFLESATLTPSKVFSLFIICPVLLWILSRQLFFIAYIIPCAVRTRIGTKRLRNYFALPREKKVVKPIDKEILKTIILTILRQHTYMEYEKLVEEICRYDFSEGLFDPVMKHLIEEKYVKVQGQQDIRLVTGCNPAPENIKRMSGQKYSRMGL